MKRYPGVKPFETADRALFFGRDRDIEDMLDLIGLEKLMVLFSKSGYGKSSLINAGLLPKIEHDALPIVVRFGSYVAGQTLPLEQVLRKTEEKLVYNPEADFIEGLPVPKTLWHLFKRKQSSEQQRFVLIFDQFEEFFTYPLADQKAFKEQLEGDYDSPPFTYSENALRVMTQKLAETKASQKSGIEAFQLQILCEYLEDKIIKGEIPKNIIEPQCFEDKINDIYEGYYQRLIDKLDPAVQHQAQLLIEEQLIFSDEKTGEARRLSVDSGVLMHDAQISQSLLNQLESHFLLRREATSTGGFNYEVTHDTMIAPILKTKAERQAREFAEKQALEAKARRRKMWIYGSLIALVMAIILAVGAKMWQLTNEAIKAKNEAIEAKNQAIQAQKQAVIEQEKAVRALEARDSVKRVEDSTNFISALQNAKIILKGGNCPPEELNQSIQTRKEHNQLTKALQLTIDTIRLLSTQNNCKL
jgi:hypothetical protein